MSKHNKYNKKNNVAINTEQSIDTEAKDIFNKIVSVSSQPKDDINNFDELVALFNQNQSKKTMLRILKQNKLLDKVTDQAISRIEDNPDDFTNVELLNYMKIAQDALSTSQKALSLQQEQTKTPLIQINQQNINTSDNQMSRESQEKIVNVVNQLLEIMNSHQDSIDTEVVEAEFKEEETNDEK